jgi:hypothetical protein
LDENYLASADVTKLKEQSREVLILINAYLRYLRSRSVSVRETDKADHDRINGLDDQLL